MAAGCLVEVRYAVDDVLAGWSGVLTEVALVMRAFLGAETLILRGLDRDQLPFRGARRRAAGDLAALESRQ